MGLSPESDSPTLPGRDNSLALKNPIIIGDSNQADAIIAQPNTGTEPGFKPVSTTGNRARNYTRKLHQTQSHQSDFAESHLLATGESHSAHSNRVPLFVKVLQIPISPINTWCFVVLQLVSRFKSVSLWNTRFSPREASEFHSGAATVCLGNGSVFTGQSRNAGPITQSTQPGFVSDAAAPPLEWETNIFIQPHSGWSQRACSPAAMRDEAFVPFHTGDTLRNRDGTAAEIKQSTQPLVSLNFPGSTVYTRAVGVREFVFHLIQDAEFQKSVAGICVA